MNEPLEDPINRVNFNSMIGSRKPSHETIIVEEKVLNLPSKQHHKTNDEAPRPELDAHEKTEV